MSVGSGLSGVRLGVWFDFLGTQGRGGVKSSGALGRSGVRSLVPLWGRGLVFLWWCWVEVGSDFLRAQGWVGVRSSGALGRCRVMFSRVARWSEVRISGDTG